MKKLIIYGYSDDLIEIEGDLREEIDVGGKITDITISDGSIITIDYSISRSGLWSIQIKNQTSDVKLTHYNELDIISNEIDIPDYSDSIKIEGNITWVEIGDERLYL